MEIESWKDYDDVEFIELVQADEYNNVLGDLTTALNRIVSPSEYNSAMAWDRFRECSMGGIPTLSIKKEVFEKLGAATRAQLFSYAEGFIAGARCVDTLKF